MDITELSTEVTESDIDPAVEAEQNRELNDRLIREQVRAFAARNREQANRLRLRALETGEIMFGVIGRYDAAINRYQRTADIMEGAALADDPRQFIEAAFSRNRDQDPGRAQRNGNVCRWIALSLGIVLAAGVFSFVLVELMARRADDQPTSDIKLFPDNEAKDSETKTMVFDHHDNWMKQPNDEFWLTTMSPVTAMAIPASGKPPTLGDQLLYLNYIKTLSGSQDPFVWASGQDFMDKVTELSGLFDINRPNHYVPIYERLATLNYQGQPLPRSVAAELMQYALAEIGRKFT